MLKQAAQEISQQAMKYLASIRGDFSSVPSSPIPTEVVNLLSEDVGIDPYLVVEVINSIYIYAFMFIPIPTGYILCRF